MDLRLGRPAGRGSPERRARRRRPPARPPTRPRAQVADQHGVQLGRSQHSVKELSLAGLSGDYRRIIHRPRDLEWRIMRYSDPLEDGLVTTDYEELVGCCMGQEGRQRGGKRQRREGEGEQQQEAQGEQQREAQGEPGGAAAEGGAAAAAAAAAQEGQLMALLLTFKLPSSCYATMLLREITKASTSKSFQKGLAVE
jgi:tRNA pseudouridine13 synthase